jgi:ABC-type polysaccharide/polyol phosphate export permease
MLPLLIAIQLALAIGLTLPVAALSVFYSDVRHALPIALMTLFYASPVFYPASLVPEEFRWLYMLNPFAGLLTLYQDCVYRGVFPSLGLVLGVSAFSFAIAALGYAIFRRHAPIYAELV